MWCNILVVAPHADDEVLGCGGTIAKCRDQGGNVFVLILGQAPLSKYSEEQQLQPLKEALEANKKLGVTQTYFGRFDALFFETMPQFKISEKIASIVFKHDIDTLFIPHIGDIHKDHTTTHLASLVAARPIDGCPVKRIFSYETLSETEWSPYRTGDIFCPNVFVDISGHIEKKIAAIQCYKSQLKHDYHPRSEFGIRSLANMRGSVVSLKAAEAFQLIRNIYTEI